MSQNIPINNFDPNQILFSAARPLAGIVQTGSVTYDADFVDSHGVGIYGRWIYVGTSGDLAYMKYDGTTETLPNLAGGVWHPIAAKRVLTTGSTIAAAQLRWGM